MRQMHLLTAAEAVACSGSQCFVLLCNIDRYWHALDLSVLDYCTTLPHGDRADSYPMWCLLSAETILSTLHGFSSRDQGRGPHGGWYYESSFIDEHREKLMNGETVWTLKIQAQKS